MGYFKRIALPSSPWGHIDRQHQIADGIIETETASHGGLWLDDRRLAAVPLAWRLARFGPQRTATSPWFEEDCDWCFVVLAHPDPFPVEARRKAAETFALYAVTRFDGRAA